VNLAILIGQFPPGVFGGAELQAGQWARRLATRHRITVVTRCNSAAPAGRTNRDGFELVRLPVSRLPLIRTLRDLAAIRRTVAALDPRPDLLLCFQTFLSGYAGVRLQAAFGLPAVVWVRGEDEIRMKASARTRWASPRTWRRARGVIVQSRELGDALLGELSPDARRAVEAHLEVVPNAIELPAMVAFAGRGPRVLSVGRLIPIKGMDVVIDAVAGSSGLTIAGDGPERDVLAARAARSGADVQFEGFVPPAELGRLYRDASCVVLASRFGEGFPNVVLEAMAHGCPVIAARVTGVGELIQDGVNGLLVPPGDPPALRAAIARLAGDRGLAERLGAAARRTAEGYAWERVEPQLEALLERWGRPA
jgi:colanic acid/amylovoran biosynthesis glycosyltransferase